jgi:sugar phosphate isomerase/epimerase
MRVGVFAKTFPGSNPLVVLGASKQAGFEAVQYNLSCSGLDPLPNTIPDETADRVSSASRITGIAVAAVSATYNMVDPNIERKASGHRAFAAIAATAGQMGTRLLTVCSGSKDPADQWRHHPANDEPGTWSEMCREFESVLGVAEQHGLLVGVEPEHANVVSSAGKAALLLNQFAGSRIRIVLDPANLLEGVPLERHHRVIEESLELLGPWIVLAHAKDRSVDGRVAPAGLGVVDWRHFLRGLASAGFDGDLIAHGMSATEAPAVAAFLKREIGQL